MSQQIIRSLYESRLSTWAAARVPALQVAYENVSFTPPDGIYLRAFMMPAGTFSEDLKGDHREYLGVFQVNIIAPIDIGSGDAQAIVAELNTLFPNNLRLSQSAFVVQIITPVSEGPAIPNLNTHTIPISFNYRSDTI